MKKNINLTISADISVNTAVELLSETVEQITQKQVSTIEGRYDESGKFIGFHVEFSGYDLSEVETVIDKSFRPMKFN